MRKASRAGLFLAAAVVALALARTVAGADIPRLTGPVTDRTGALAGSTSEVTSALETLLREHGVQLYVVVVPTTADLTVTGFADETARVNSLGVDDALLVVALDDRTDAIWVSDSLTQITNPEIDAIIHGTLEPGLRAGAYGNAVVATARALGDAAGSAGTDVTPSATPGPSPAPAGGIGWVGLLAGLAILGGLLLVGRWVVGWRTASEAAEARDRQTADRAREANRLLIATDERIRSAAEEAGFVEAEYGAAEAEPFRAAIAEARDELGAAFTIRQKLDDAEPEDPPTRDAMLKEIVERLGRAGAALDRQAARIKGLRDLERSAPQIVAALPDQVAAVEARLPASEAALKSLSAYAPSTWTAVRGNVEEARKGLGGARAAIDRANAALGRNDARTAAREIGTAQEGVAGSARLLDAVDRLASTAHDLEGRIGEQLALARQNVADARSALGPDGATGDAAAAGLAAAEEAIRAAQGAAEASPLDPIAAHHLATAAHTQASDLLAGARRDAALRAQREAAVDAALRAAREAVRQAADFIATRRSGVGSQARTRLAEAERVLANAEAARASDPDATLELARRAHELAADAYRSAARDFDEWDRGDRPPGGSGSNDMAGAILGGIIGGILSGGGRGGWGGGWGGSPWGSQGPFGGGSGGWGGGRSRGGGFGGFGGGSGGFGGFGGGSGGGRSRGGHW